MKKIFILFFLIGCSYQFRPQDQADQLILQLEAFFNLKENSFDLTELDYQLLATPFRLNIEEDHYTYQLVEDEDSFNYCPGSVKLKPQTKNVIENIKNEIYYGYDVIYSCNTKLDKTSNLYIIFVNSNDIYRLEHIGVDAIDFETILLNQEEITYEIN